jgi:hypothetical protein
MFSPLGARFRIRKHILSARHSRGSREPPSKAEATKRLLDAIIRNDVAALEMLKPNPTLLRAWLKAEWFKSNAWYPTGGAQKGGERDLFAPDSAPRNPLIPSSPGSAPLPH